MWWVRRNYSCHQYFTRLPSVCPRYLIKMLEEFLEIRT
jgi:hypothetical protein